MTLRTRLAVALLAIGLVLTAPVLIARRSLRSLDSQINELRRNEFSASILLGRMRGQIDELQRAEDNVTFFPDSATQSQKEAELERLRTATKELERFALGDAGTRIATALSRVSELAPADYQAALAKQTARADSLSDSTRAAIARAEGAINSAETQLRIRTGEKVEKAAAASDDAQQAAVLAFAAAAVLATLIGVWLVRSISRPVRDLERGMEAVAAGDFGHRLRLRPDRNDEFARLAASYHTMSAQLAELDKLKAEFVSVASHELKTPINVIGGYLQLLEEGVYGPLTPKQLEVCATIAAQCDSLARLVRQLLDVSRFEAGGGKIEPRRFVLRTFLDDLERAFHVLALQRGVRLRVTRGMGLPEEVTWDADRINEVLGNMLSNAFKFTPRGGTVDLLAEPVDGGVQLSVRDTGAGIPPAQLPHIFKKFYQADNQASASAKGTGLGLAISKGIVDAHGGSVAVDSTVGVGTTFTIVLPEHVRSARRVTPPRRATAGV
jgi:signal transduction histidine kinase